MLFLFTVCCFVTDKEVHPGIKEMENMILECAKLDREINYFVDVVQQVTSEVTATWLCLNTWRKSIRSSSTVLTDVLVE